MTRPSADELKAFCRNLELSLLKALAEDRPVLVEETTQFGFNCTGSFPFYDVITLTIWRFSVPPSQEKETS